MIAALSALALSAATLGCMINPPSTVGSGEAGESAGSWGDRLPDWVRTNPFPTNESDSGTFGEGGTRGPDIAVTFPNSGDEWRGHRVTVVGRMVSPNDPVTSAHAEVSGQRTRIAVQSGGNFEVPVALQLGHNEIKLSANTQSGAKSDVFIKVRRIPGMGVDPSVPKSSVPSVVLTSPRKGQSASQDEIDVVGKVRAPSGVSRIEIYANGDLVQEKTLTGTKREVSFRQRISLRRGNNVITVTGLDAKDRTAHEVASVLYAVRSTGGEREDLGEIRRKYAVVIGVANYKHGDQISPLLYADKDAELFASILREAGFDKVRLLTNKRATSAAVRNEIFDFLSEAVTEDLVVIYFAGHGAPDPKNLGNLYFLTYDTDVDRMAATAFPMWEMETAIQSKIHSERVVMIADACHSGGIGSDLLTRGIQLSANPAHDYLRAMAGTRGRVAFTASEASELSQESQRWGGGHGAFTWSLAEGLRGKADKDGNQVISLGEMIDYTSEQVRRLTRSQQHPDTSGRFDRGLPILVLPGARGG